MKTSLALAAVVSYAIFAVVLLFQLAGEKRNPSWQCLLDEGAFHKERDGGKYVLHQSSNKAIIDVNSSAFAEAIYSGKVKIVCDQAGSSTLIRIMTGEPSILNGKLRGPGPIPYVESNGKVVVANGAGIIVRASAAYDWDEEQGLLPIRIEEDVRLLPDRKRNVYTMAINKSGAIRADKPMMHSKPDRANEKGLKTAPVIVVGSKTDEAIPAKLDD